MSRSPLTNRIAFGAPPKPGTVLMRDGQRYELIACKDHVRKDGQPTSLLVWHSHCAECGEPFEVVTGLVARGAINRRCATHHSPGRVVSAAGKRRQHRFLSLWGRRRSERAS